MGSEDVKLVEQLLSKLLDSKIEVLDTKFKGQILLITTEFGMLNTKLQEFKDNIGILNNEISKLRSEERDHIINCPVADNVEKVKEDLKTLEQDTNKKFEENSENLIEYRILKKYPKSGLILVAIACFALFIAGFGAFKEINKKITTEIQKARTENVSSSSTHN